MVNKYRRHLLEIFEAALAAVNGRRRVRDYLQAHALRGPVSLVAIGKAATAMCDGALDVLGDGIRTALVITKYGHADSLPWPVIEAGHPLPDEQSLVAGAELERFVRDLPNSGSVLMLLSGGASTLVEGLPVGVTLAELQRINRWMLQAGLPIHTMNAIRKRLSRFKGGRLARILSPHPVLCLAISDVPDDDLRVIGSGPLVPDASLSVLPDLTPLPDFVRDALKHNPYAPPFDDTCFWRVRTEIIATLTDAKRAAVAAAEGLGYRAAVESEFIAGDAGRMGARLAQELIKSETGVVRVWGGETTVRLSSTPGRGGRSQNLALAAALTLDGEKNALLLAAGTDGSDGPTDDAGAMVDGETVTRGREHGFDARLALEAADAGNFLEASGDLLQTGPTGTNVMDIMLGLRY